MAWYTDEQYAMIQDSREKKSVAASAFKQRSHCGKGGRVRLPSDNMSKKELNAMNGECKSYRMNDPISWSEFVEWPNEHKVAYISRLREKFGVGDKIVADMFDVSCHLFLMYLKELGMETKYESDENWNREKFYTWRSGARTELVGETVDEVEIKEPDLTKPMKWDDFKTLTDEQKITYIQGIRNQFGVPDIWIGRELFDLGQSTFARVVKILNIGGGKNQGNNKGKWDKEGFLRWCGKHVEEPEIVSVPLVEEVGEERAEIIEKLCQDAVEAVDTDELFQKHVENIEAAEKKIDIPVKENKPEEHSACETHCTTPIEGQMRFKGNADDILRTIRMLTGGKNVSLYVDWRVMEE